jgi:hypothetical protein
MAGITPAAKPASVSVTVPSSTSANSRSTARPNAPSIRERQYPFAGSGFVPKSRREREAEAARIPLPPSPSSSHQQLSEVPKTLTSEAVEESSASNEPTEPPSASPPREIEPVTSTQHSVPTPFVTERKSAHAFVNKLQPSFRPRRGGANVGSSTTSRTQPQSQARKVSAFGAPAIITKVQPIVAPPVHSASAVAMGITTKGAPKNKPSLHTIGLPGTGSRSAASSISSRSVSAHASVTVVAANSTVGPNEAESAPHFSKTVASSRDRVVSNPVPTTSKSTVTQKTDPPLPVAAAKHETRARNATGMTLSQLLKQKPPVHKKGFVPTSKLRGAKSNANLKGAIPSAQKQHQHQHLPPAEKSSNAEPEMAARMPLPPSPKGEAAHLLPAEIPLPPSPVPAAAQVDGRIGPAHEEPHHSFPTIESIKERLNEVLGPESLSSDTVLACSAALSEGEATVPIFCTPVLSAAESEEPEFTLDDLEIPPRTPDSMVSVPSVLAAKDTGSGDDLEITPVTESDFVQGEEPVVLASRPSSPMKSVTEKPSRELEARTVLGEVGINMEV